MEQYTLETPLGLLTVTGTVAGISCIAFSDQGTISKGAVPSLLQNAVVQLQEYFAGERITFEVNLNPHGTDFQKKVWNQLLTIPFGKTRSYQEIATQLGDPKVIRAAASANGKNPIAIMIPCHRVIGSDGSLTGYAGGLHRKKKLLDLESPVTQTTLF
ncbi:methylated-DNA--[protein]-cysteine S-methyltransferase [Altibacter sp. HG106]|uniref:methylated-DNA--[protein]-cysteine S-methyltransferase n=1 Tax=Altibacter sp. HG106 TaxID=3023937 RepID=UPI00235075B9|nr:methylated-DNA--[protein]-cysteine S-methyltransferase [Altibacter sp. HG106]MDC7995059.1 methylated-DNA--[protein]-cysteine S-methyltransferase [Altibacter sp. HG106]